MRRAYLAMWTVLIGLVVAPVQPAPAFEAAAPAVSWGVVKGRVTDPGGAAVAGACVTIYISSGEQMGRDCTDANGDYEFPYVTYESLKLRVTKPGYRSLWWPNRLDYAVGLTAGTLPGQTVIRDFVLGDTVSGGLTGLIKRQDTTPAAFAEVGIYPVGSTAAIAWSQVKADGTFARDDLPPGQYNISVRGSGYAVQWHPSQTTRANAAVVTVSAGETASFEEQFLPVNPAPAPPAVVAVTGRVIAKPGDAPVAGAQVTLYHSTWFDQVVGTAVSDSQGNFLVPGMRSGLVKAKVEAAGFAVRWAPDSLRPSNFSTSTPIQAVLRAGSGTLRFSVRDHTGDPPGFLSSARLWNLADNSVSVLNLPFTGDLEVPNLPAGQYKMEIDPLNPPYPQPIPPNQWYPGVIDFQEAVAFTVGDGQTVELTQNLIAPAAAEITVLDALTGQPVSDACVQLNVIKCAGVDGVYRFDFDWQTMSHWLTVDKKPYYFTFNKTVEVRAGEVTRVTVMLEPGAVIAASFAYPDDMNPAGHSLCVHAVTGPWGADTPGGPICATTDEHGGAVFGPFKPGVVNLFVRDHYRDGGVGAQWVSPSGGTGDRRKAEEFTLVAGSTHKVPVIRLDRPGYIFGTINHEDPAVAPGGCAYAGPGIEACTINHEDGTVSYELAGLGPYEWPIEFSGGPHDAVVWSGGANNRFDATLVKVGSAGGAPIVNATLHYGAGFYNFDFGGTEPDYWTMTAFDAETGDKIRFAGGYLPGLPRRPIVLRFDGGAPTNLTCWVYFDRGGTGRFSKTPYIQMGAFNRSGVRVVPGETCLTTAPQLLNVVPPRVSPPRSRPLLEHLDATLAPARTTAPQIFVMPADGRNGRDLSRSARRSG